MASKRIPGASSRLVRSFRGLTIGEPTLQCLAPPATRGMATQVATPEAALSEAIGMALESSAAAIARPLRRPPPTIPDVVTTIYSFPKFEPQAFANYPANHLDLPLRRDILHRAVVFEGDSERQGTASTKWRSEVRGSGRKIRPQKGTGMARLGDKNSPMLKGGGVAFGPKPRDFSTKLPKKMYDLAWRTALSHRYRLGQLLIVEDAIKLEMTEPKWLVKILTENEMSRAHGRSMIVTKKLDPRLAAAAKQAGEHVKVRSEEQVDVKNLLELGRVIIEKRALDSILREHSSDLERRVKSAVGLELSSS